MKPLKSSVVDGFRLFKYFEATKFRISCEEGILREAVAFKVCDGLGVAGTTAFPSIFPRASSGQGMALFATFPLREAVVFDTCDWLEVTGATAPSLITPWDSSVCPTITVDTCCRPGPGMASQSIFNLRRANEKKESVKCGCVDV